MTKTALITGASSGIGLELTKLFATDGFRLVLVAQDEKKLNQLAQDLARTHRVTIVPIALDLSMPDASARLVSYVNEKKLHIDILVNNAGFGKRGDFTTMDMKMMTTMIGVNITTLTQLTRLFGAEMVARRSGKILNVASVAAFFPGPLMAVYYATKAYVLSLGEALAEEWRGSGVTITTLCPGPTITNFQNRAGVAHSGLFRSQTMDPATVALIAYRGLKQRKRVVVPGLMNQLEVFFARFVPQHWAARVIKRLHE